MDILSIEKAKEEIVQGKNRSKRVALACGVATASPFAALMGAQVFTIQSVVPTFTAIQPWIVSAGIAAGSAACAAGMLWAIRGALKMELEEQNEQHEKIVQKSKPEVDQLAAESAVRIKTDEVWDFSKTYIQRDSFGFLSNESLSNANGHVNSDGYIGVSSDDGLFLRRGSEERLWFALAHEHGHRNLADTRKIDDRFFNARVFAFITILASGLSSFAAVMFVDKNMAALSVLPVLAAAPAGVFVVDKIADLLRYKSAREKEFAADEYAAITLGSIEGGSSFFKKEIYKNKSATRGLTDPLKRMMCTRLSVDTAKRWIFPLEKVLSASLYEKTVRKICAIKDMYDEVHRDHPSCEARLKNLERLEKRMIQKGAWAVEAAPN